MTIRSVFAPVSMTVALTTMVAFGEVIYENDFTTRTSKEPIPAYGVRQESQPYPTKSAFLCTRPSGNAGTYDAASLATYFNEGAGSSGFSRPGVDGWFMPYFNNIQKLVPRYLTPAGSEGLADTPVFTWSYGVSTENRTGYVIQSLHNEFTNGQLRIQVDLKAPIRWAKKSAWFKVFPVYRKYMDILVWNNSPCDMLVTPGKFGFRATGGNAASDLLKTFPQYYDSRNDSGSTTQCGNNYSPDYNYWYRFVVTYDLDAKTFFGDLYKLDSILNGGCPTLETATPATPTVSFGHSGDTRTVEAFMTNPSTETGGIAGLGIAGYGNFTAAKSDGLGCTTNKVFADNFRLSWKAPGAEDFEVFYENDFSNRWYKTLCASVRAATGAYSASVATVAETNSFSGYTATTSMDVSRIVRTTENTTSAQAIGLDGWRKLPFYAKMNGNPAVVAYGGNPTNDVGGTGGNMLAYGDQSGVSRLVQTLGTSFSSGSVRIVADARLPWGGNLTTELPATVKRRLGIGLGSAALYDTDRANVPANLAGGVGYERLAATGACLHKPFTIVSGGGSNGEPAINYLDPYTAPESNSWYRIEVTANLGTKKYDVSVTPLGAASVTADDAATESPIFSATGLDFAANVSDIGSFYLCAYGYGSGANNSTGQNMNNRVCWDNIRVYHDADLVYENDFTTRTRCIAAVSRETGDLAALQSNLDGGQDHWVRRDYTGAAGFDARATVRDDNGNQFLALGRSGEEGRTILVGNELGASVKRPFRFVADIRPPTQWSAKSGNVKIALGDSQMVQTETPESVYGAHRLVSFGFDGTNTANATACPYYFKGCKAKIGDTTLDTAIDETHWYRFLVKADPDAGTYDVRLYDMGTAHPTAEMAGGTLVATATGIAFENALAVGEGVSTIHIAGDGLSGAVGSLGIDPAHALVDNLKLSDIPSFSISIR